jgi:hypothetical protein
MSTSDSPLRAARSVLRICCAGCEWAAMQLRTVGEPLEVLDLVVGEVIAIKDLPRDADGGRVLLCLCCLEQARAIMQEGQVFDLWVFREATREQTRFQMGASDDEELSDLVEDIRQGRPVPPVAPLGDEECEAIRALDDRRPYYKRALETRRRSDDWNERRSAALRDRLS